MDSITATAILDIDLDAIAENIRAIRARVAPACAVAGVVKADAYGIGLAAVARTHRACGTGSFFVATPDEGIALRAVIGDVPEIAVLGGVFHGAEDVYKHHGLSPVLNSPGDLQRWAVTGDGAPAMIHLDTGMRRLGFDTREADALAADPQQLERVNITAIMSHFACADEKDHPLTAAQHARFDALVRAFPKMRKTLSNSAGIFVSRAYDYDMVRPGMAIYGLNPAPHAPNPMRPVVSLRARVLQIRDALKGESVGYGAAHICTAPTRVATIALGYADGFLRSLSGRGKVWAGDVPLPILGRVSMDLIGVDAGAAPTLKPGDWVSVIGPRQDADSLAAMAGTIGYEILTGLGPRYHRVYHGMKTFESKANSG